MFTSGRRVGSMTSFIIAGLPSPVMPTNILVAHQSLGKLFERTQWRKLLHCGVHGNLTKWIKA